MTRAAWRLALALGAACGSSGERGAPAAGAGSAVAVVLRTRPAAVTRVTMKALGIT